MAARAREAGAENARFGGAIPLYSLKLMIILPRQARDKRIGETTQKRAAVFAGGGAPVVAAGSADGQPCQQPR